MRLIILTLIVCLASHAEADFSAKEDTLLEERIRLFSTTQKFEDGSFLGWMSGSCVFASFANEEQGKVFFISEVHGQDRCEEPSVNFNFGGERHKPKDFYDNLQDDMIAAIQSYMNSDQYKSLVSYRDGNDNLAVNVNMHNRKLTLKRSGANLWLRGQLIESEGEMGPGSVHFICEFIKVITPETESDLNGLFE